MRSAPTAPSWRRTTSRGIWCETPPRRCGGDPPLKGRGKPSRRDAAGPCRTRGPRAVGALVGVEAEVGEGDQLVGLGGVVGVDGQADAGRHWALVLAAEEPGDRGEAALYSRHGGGGPL